MDLPLRIEPDGPEPLHRQLYRQVRTAILDGRLPPGSRLPPTRDFARTLGLSRNTISEAYAALLAEGYLDARTGAGTYVAAHLPDTLLTLDGTPAPPPAPGSRAEGARIGAQAVAPGQGRRHLSTWAARVAAADPPSLGGRRAAPLPYDFRPGLPAADAFPALTWRRLVAAAWEDGGPETLLADDPAGYAPLRAAIATYLGRARAVRCTADQVIVGSGAQQTLDLLARLLLDPGDAVVVEDPCYGGAQRVFGAAGARLLSVPVDTEGLVVDALPASGAPRLVYVTPSHQYPTGAILSLPRRLHLLEWAARTGALVIEDDYDSQYRYTGRPLESLQGLDRRGAVIYTGSFSTALFPALRLGYVVLPPDLVALYGQAQGVAGRGAAAPLQRALAAFFAEGHFERHLRRMRALYAARRDALLAALAQDLPEAIPGPAESGMHLHVAFPTPVDEARLAVAAACEGVGIYPAGPYHLAPPPRSAILLGFAALPEPAIAAGIRRLAGVLHAG